MKTYGQYCALSKALDVIGDRWTLLIIRELLIRGGCRFTDLRNGLPGIATNLLATRLDELDRAGIIRREPARPPVATPLIRLTPRGAALAPVIQELAQWGAPLLDAAPETDAFRSHWMAIPLELHLRDHTPHRRAVAVELRTGGEPITVETAGDGLVQVRTGVVDRPDLILSGEPRLLLATLLGSLTIDAAENAGVEVDGDLESLRRIQPKAMPRARDADFLD